jgi:hypothetical protein
MIPNCKPRAALQMHGNTVITAAWDGLVKVWEIAGAQAECKFTFRDHTAGVFLVLAVANACTSDAMNTYRRAMAGSGAIADVKVIAAAILYFAAVLSLAFNGGRCCVTGMSPCGALRGRQWDVSAEPMAPYTLLCCCCKDVLAMQDRLTTRCGSLTSGKARHALLTFRTVSSDQPRGLSCHCFTPY